MISGRAAVAACRQRNRKPLSRGFTLLEVLIVVTIAAIILALGIPSFQNTILSNRLTTTANAFVSTYNSARLAAIQRNAAVQFCSSSTTTNGAEVLGTNCGAETTGAALMLNAGGTTTTRVAAGPAVPAGLTLTSSAALRFNGQGFARAAVSGTAPYTGLLLDLSTSRFATNNRRCIYLATGSIISVCSVSGTGACNASEPSSCG
ncbi:MAG: GspH/FimT family pseudopilin [Stagnimonas sp.]|nr:GspH/FimT family pseudopilin [Stagnimonas sp.]